jgi:hypothetical protein
MESLEKSNRELDEIGRQLFGGQATLRIVDPRTLVFRKENARFFKKETFGRLVENIRQDGRLSSVPLCRDAGPEGLEVLSGKHRVEACVLAGVALILVIVILAPLDPSRQVAIQLSHNALSGEDDPRILSTLFSRIESIRDRLYAGLSSDALAEIKKIDLVTFKTPSVSIRAVTFAFTDPEAASVEKVLEELRTYQGSTAVYLARADAFEPFYMALQAVKKREKIKNASLAMVRLCEIVREALK